MEISPQAGTVLGVLASAATYLYASWRANRWSDDHAHPPNAPPREKNRHEEAVQRVFYATGDRVQTVLFLLAAIISTLGVEIMQDVAIGLAGALGISVLKNSWTTLRQLRNGPA